MADHDCGVVGMWPTPLHLSDLGADRDFSEMNEDRRRLVLLRERSESDPMDFGTIGATKTSLSIMRWEIPPVQWLKRHISTGIAEVSQSVGADRPQDAKLRTLVDGWVVVYRSAASHRLHTHHGSAWSGVYYIATGDTQEGS
mgnify:CR=1 FL=1